MTIVVTGAAGFMGSTLTETLLSRGEQVIALDNFNDYYSPARKRANVAPFQNHPNLRFYLPDYNPQTPVTEGLARLWEWYQREVIGSAPIKS